MRSARFNRSLVYRCAALAAVLTGLLAFAASAGADFGVKPGGLESSLLDGSGTVVNPAQAGAHPASQQIRFTLNTHHNDYPASPEGTFGGSGPETDPDGQIKTAVTELPPGLIGDPGAVPLCEQSDFPPPGFGGYSRCPTDTQVGTASIDIGINSGLQFPFGIYNSPVFNLVPPKGVIARVGFVFVVPVVVDITLRSDGDYGLNATAADISQSINLYSSRVTLWGVPADSSHDDERFLPGNFFPGNPPGSGIGIPSELPLAPFMANPTRCGVDLTTGLEVDSWEDPGDFLSYRSEPVSFTGCDQLDFEPSIEAKPTTDAADVPAGLDFDLHIPQNEDPDGLVTSHLRDAVVKLPVGMTVNPPSADVLEACSLAQVGMSADGVADLNPVTCPDASILGRATVVTPPIGHPLPALIYLAKQNENPFGSLLAMYLVIDDPISGIRIKLPGKIDADPQTGQLTVSFRENPQTPVEDIEMRFFGGPHAALKTPASCGAHTVTSSMTPWTAPEGETKSPSSSFALTAGPGGGACPAAGAGAPSQFSFLAGTTARTAKAFSPFNLKLSRADGTQQLSKIDTTLPKGLIARLAGVPYCSELDIYKAEQKSSGKAEQASPSCPASSRVGSVDVGAGAGSAPLYVSGNAYLAGPYKGAPLSLVVITPAVAGPFDLGNVVVRNALYLDPETTQVRAVSDPLPTILQGIPLNLRSIALKMDRPDFTLNPTDCDPLAVTGAATTVFGQSASLTSPFQVGECSRLGFKPKLSLKLTGGTKRGNYPALKAVLEMKGGANTARASVALPHSEFLAQNHIRTICTRVQFAAGAGNGAECPKGSIYGKARAITPLLDEPLSGPVYLRSSDNPLPDLVAALHGQIDVYLVGRIDSKNGGIRTTFDSVPDAPVTKFVLEMQGGKKGLLENSPPGGSQTLCESVNRASVRMDAQNGKSSGSTPVLRNGCKGRTGRKQRDGGGEK
jgi:hypothetical protein